MGVVNTKSGTVSVNFSPNSPTVDLFLATDLESGTGKIAVGTTAVEVDFTGQTRTIIITADKNNTGILFIGESTVDNTGANAMTFIERGDSVELDYEDSSNAVYVVSDTASQGFYKGALIE